MLCLVTKTIVIKIQIMLNIETNKEFITYNEFNSFSHGINNTSENVILNTMAILSCKT